jgi:hypothetical protein
LEEKIMKVFPSGKQIVTEPIVFKQLCQFNKPILGPDAIDSPIWRQAPQVGLADPNHAFMLFDDFLGYITTQNGWTTAGTGATVACDETVKGGVLLLTSSGTDNQAAIAGRTYEEFTLEVGKKLFFEARVMPAELNTDDVNIFVGLTQGTLADAVPLIDDAGGEVVADDDLIGWVKSDGGTVWTAFSADGAAAYESTDCNTRVVDTWVRLGFIATPTQIDFYIDGELVATHVTTIPTASEEMTAAIVVKCGSANAETLQCDWIKVVQER